MTVKAEIFSQGEEVVTGQTVDSNAAWLSQQLIQEGLTITRHTTVGDKLDDLVSLLQEIAGRADCCICTGGLGPTIDDLTAEAVSRAFELPLQFDARAYARMQRFFRARNRRMPEANRKQAMIPQGAIRLDNDWGTAPGFALEYRACWFAFVPGVPYEMKQIYQHRIKPILQRKFALLPWQLVSIKTIGIGESDIQERLQAVTLPANVQLGFRAGKNDVQTKLLFPPDFPEDAIRACAQAVARAIGDYVYLIEGFEGPSGGMVEATGALLASRQLTLSVLETISQGMIAAKCIGHDWLKNSCWSASVDDLYRQMGLAQRPETTRESAISLAQALKQQTATDLALVQLYEAERVLSTDPDSRLTLHLALATHDGVTTCRKQIAGPLKRKQNQAALLALDFVRRYLQEQIY